MASGRSGCTVDAVGNLECPDDHTTLLQNKVVVAHKEQSGTGAELKEEATSAEQREQKSSVADNDDEEAVSTEDEGEGLDAADLEADDEADEEAEDSIAEVQEERNDVEEQQDEEGVEDDDSQEEQDEGEEGAEEEQADEQEEEQADEEEGVEGDDSQESNEEEQADEQEEDEERDEEKEHEYSGEEQDDDDEGQEDNGEEEKEEVDDGKEENNEEEVEVDSAVGALLEEEEQELEDDKEDKQPVVVDAAALRQSQQGDGVEQLAAGALAEQAESTSQIWRPRRRRRRSRRRRARRSSRRRRARRSSRRRRARRARRASASRRRAPARRRRAAARRRRAPARKAAARSRSSARHLKTSHNAGCGWVDCNKVRAQANSRRWRSEHFAVAVGNAGGTCCTIEHGIKANAALQLKSASKMVCAYVILGIVKDRKLKLDTLVSDVLPWWTKTPQDKRSKVRVHHLLENTDGFPNFNMQMACSKSTVVECAREAYGLGVKKRPGSSFTYSETSFFILGAIAMQATGLASFDATFQKYIAKPLGMSGCSYVGKQDPGADLQCSTAEYAKFLTALTAKKLNGLPARAYTEAEKPRTKNVKTMSMGGIMGLPNKQEYGLGLWRMCPSKRCSDHELVYVHSMGFNGFIPSIYRKGGKATWLIVARNVASGIPRSMEILRDLQPKAVPFSLKGVPTTCELGCLSKTIKRGVKKVAKKVFKGAKKAAKKVAKGIKKVAKGVHRGVKKVAKGVHRGVKKVANGVKNGLKRMFGRRRRSRR